MKLNVPHDLDLEVDVIGALARNGSDRWAFAELTVDDFWTTNVAFAGLAEAHLAGELHYHLEARAETGLVRWVWPALDDRHNDIHWRVAWCCEEAADPPVIRDDLGRVAARGIRPAVDRLHELRDRRRLMTVAAELYNRIGAGDNPTEHVDELRHFLETGTAA